MDRPRHFLRRQHRASCIARRRSIQRRTEQSGVASRDGARRLRGSLPENSVSIAEYARESLRLRAPKVATAHSRGSARDDGRSSVLARLRCLRRTCDHVLPRPQWAMNRTALVRSRRTNRMWSDREVVRRHAVPLTAPHHIEAQVLEALASVGAAPFVAAFPDCHGSSSFMFFSFLFTRLELGRPD